MNNTLEKEKFLLSNLACFHPLTMGEHFATLRSAFVQVVKKEVQSKLTPEEYNLLSISIYVEGPDPNRREGGRSAELLDHLVTNSFGSLSGIEGQGFWTGKVYFYDMVSKKYRIKLSKLSSSIAKKLRHIMEIDFKYKENFLNNALKDEDLECITIRLLSSYEQSVQKHLDYYIQGIEDKKNNVPASDVLRNILRFNASPYDTHMECYKAGYTTKNDDNYTLMKKKVIAIMKLRYEK